jgi:hypothetical protein
MIKGNAGDEAARSCFHTQASLSRSVIDAVVPPGGGSKQIADSVPAAGPTGGSCAEYRTSSSACLARGSHRGGCLASRRKGERSVEPSALPTRASGKPDVIGASPMGRVRWGESDVCDNFLYCFQRPTFGAPGPTAQS